MNTTTASDIEDYKDLPIGATHKWGGTYYRLVDMVWESFGVRASSDWGRSYNKSEDSYKKCEPVPKIWSLISPKDLKPGDIVRIGDVTTKIELLNKGSGVFLEGRFIDADEAYVSYFSFHCDRTVPVQKLIDNPQFKQITTKAEETTMTKQTFTKSDLKTGMRVTTADNQTYLVMLHYHSSTSFIGDILLGESGWLDLDKYFKGLTHSNHSRFNIVKVEQTTYVCSKEFEVIWERTIETQEQKEYNKLMAQIEGLKAQAEKLKP